MIEGKLIRRRVLIRNEADASTLRNKGFVGKNLGQKLSLDLMTSLHLVLHKKMEVKSRNEILGSNEILKMLSNGQRGIAVAFDYLKSKGMKPVIKRGRLFASDKRVMSVMDRERVDFSKFNSGDRYLCVTDSEGMCLLYSVKRVHLFDTPERRKLGGNESLQEESIEETLSKRGLRIASGFKYGCEYRIYQGNSTHAEFLLTQESSTIARDLVARVRIAHSVKKRYVQEIQKNNGGRLTFFEIKWVRL